jgi:hypothetical protein
MAGIIPPRNVIYFSSNANQIPLAGIANLPYTDVIVAFLVPDGNWCPSGAPLTNRARDKGTPPVRNFRKSV